jgi:hypothetical protein
MIYEIDITDFLAKSCMRDYSASVAEIGIDAGPSTWRASCDDAPDWQFLDTDDKREEFRAFVLASGGWGRDEIAAWSDDELQALCLQWIASDVRECSLDSGPGPDVYWTLSAY